MEKALLLQLLFPLSYSRFLIHFATFSIHLVVLVLVSDASDWFPKEPNNGHLEYLLFLLAALTFLNLLVFIVVAKWYKYKKPDFEKDEDITVNPEHIHVYENNSFHDNEKKPLPEYSETSRL